MNTDTRGQGQDVNSRRGSLARPLQGLWSIAWRRPRIAYAAIPLIVGVLVLASAGLALTQSAPSLGTAASFAVLGGSTVTNTGPTIITGNLGVSPGSAVTGFPPGIVVAPGVIHAADAEAAQAQSDAAVAYTSLAGQACNRDLTGLDLGGLTLTSGVYCFDTSAQLTGELTLDVQGDPNAVFIFQMGSTLTTAPGASVVFVNGAPSCNVYWQVGSSATLGTNTSFAGNILALTSITLNTGATVTGSTLALNGAVTLDSNNVALCLAALTPTNTLLPPTGTAAAATQTAIAPTLTAIALTPPATLPAPTQTAIAATQTSIAATQIAVAPTLTAIALTPTPTNTPDPLGLDEVEQPQLPNRLYLPMGHR